MKSYGGILADLMIASMLPLFLQKGKKVAVRHQETCPECKRSLVNLYSHKGEWKCKKCWDKEELEPPKLIKTWDELRECKSGTHYLEIEKHAGWIRPNNPLNDSHYLSTHTFYGHHHEQSTELLQSCGFNVVIANWDE